MSLVLCLWADSRFGGLECGAAVEDHERSELVGKLQPHWLLLVHCVDVGHGPLTQKVDLCPF